MVSSEILSRTIPGNPPRFSSIILPGLRHEIPLAISQGVLRGISGYFHRDYSENFHNNYPGRIFPLTFPLIHSIVTLGDLLKIPTAVLPIKFIAIIEKFLMKFV